MRLDMAQLNALADQMERRERELKDRKDPGPVADPADVVRLGRIFRKKGHWPLCEFCDKSEAELILAQTFIGSLTRLEQTNGGDCFSVNTLHHHEGNAEGLHVLRVRGYILEEAIDCPNDLRKKYGQRLREDKLPVFRVTALAVQAIDNHLKTKGRT